MHNKVARIVYDQITEKSTDKLFAELGIANQSIKPSVNEVKIIERAKERIKFQYVFKIIRPLRTELGLKYGTKGPKLEENDKNSAMILDKLKDIAGDLDQD